MMFLHVDILILLGKPGEYQSCPKSSGSDGQWYRGWGGVLSPVREGRGSVALVLPVSNWVQSWCQPQVLVLEHGTCQDISVFLGEMGSTPLIEANVSLPGRWLP